MHHETGGFVDHEQMRVSINHIQQHGLCLEGLALRGWTQLDQTRIRDPDLMRCLDKHLPVDLDTASLNELLQIVA